MRTLAVLVNLFLWPGWGHYALGRYVRGHIWAGASLLCILLVPLHPALAMGGMLMRIPAALDAAFVQIHPTPSGGRWGLIPGGVGALVVAFVLMRVYYLEGFKIPSGGQIPTLQIGDHLFINKLSYRLGAPAPGDMIVFVHPCEPDKDFVERVVALGGDTVELRCDVLYVNGVAAPTRPSPGECSYQDRDMKGEWDEVECTRYTETLGEVEHPILYGPDRPDLDEQRSSAAPGDYMRVQGRHDFPGDRAASCMDMEGGGASDRPAGRIEESTPESGVVAGACRPQRRYRVPAGHVFTLGDNRDNSSDSRVWGPVPVDSIKGRVIGIWWSTDHRGIHWSRIGHVR